MAAIKIIFPKSGRTMSTWLPDEDWVHLSKQQQGALINRFIRRHFAKELADSQAQTFPRNTPNYRWEEI